MEIKITTFCLHIFFLYSIHIKQNLYKANSSFTSQITVASAVPGAAGPWGGWGGLGAGAGAAGGAPVANPWLPPWISTAPWFPQWGPCTMIGSTCLDCNTKMVCTKVGGLQRPCSDPTLPHCNLGACSATPSDECAVSAVPANAAA